MIAAKAAPTAALHDNLLTILQMARFYLAPRTYGMRALYLLHLMMDLPTTAA